MVLVGEGLEQRATSEAGEEKQRRDEPEARASSVGVLGGRKTLLHLRELGGR